MEETIQALNTLYAASKQARLSYEEHAICQNAFKLLETKLKETPKEKR